MANQSITIRRRDPGGKTWGEIPLDELRGKKLGDAFLAYDGMDVVAEFINGEKKGYFCGSEQWREYYREKGFTALTFKEAVEILRKKGSPLIEALCPAVEAVEDVFPGSTLTSVSLFD